MYPCVFELLSLSSRKPKVNVCNTGQKLNPWLYQQSFVREVSLMFPMMA